jgi:hypothetical protein
MNWSILKAPKSLYFLTSDHPVFYFADIGIGSVPWVDLSFPITREYCLYLHWSNQFNEGLVNVQNHWISEINNRSIYNCYKYVFSLLSEPWIIKVINRNRKPSYLIPQNTKPILGFYKARFLHKIIEERHFSDLH